MFIAIVIVVTVELAKASQVCYPPYGCFNDDAPFDEALVQLPWSPKDLDTKFFFYNRTYSDQPLQILDPEDLRSPSKLQFNPNKKTVILTHGYIESRIRWWVPLFLDELLFSEDMNIIFVEWRNGAAFPYHSAVGNTRMVGAQVGRMIEVLHNDTGLDWSRLHLIGFSLGAHVMGYAGRNLRRKGIILPRISAIDPASPYFENKHIDRRIDPTDADFVDVIHSDSKTLIVNGFGTVQNMGHLDFYPNGGHDQPGCWNFDRSVVQYLACSHYRSLSLYIESINTPCPYFGYPCKNYDNFTKLVCSQCGRVGCPQMGYHATPMDQKTLGVRYYLQTHSEERYCGYHYKVSLHTGSGFLKDLDGVVTLELTGDRHKEIVTAEGKYYGAGKVEYWMVLAKKDLGRLLKVKVQHDRYLDIWYLESVVVRPMWQNVQYVACYNRWLNTAANEVDFLIGDSNLCKKTVVGLY